MWGAQYGEVFFRELGEVQLYPPAVVGVRRPVQVAGGGGAVDQPAGAVLTQAELDGDTAYPGRGPGVGVHSEQQVVLGVGEAEPARVPRLDAGTVRGLPGRRPGAGSPAAAVG